jgi:RNA polymerase sigma factor (sigma-70 family)
MRCPDDGAHESDLVELAKRGDTAAYGELVRIHQREARRVAAAIGGIDIADDCAQEAFLRGFRSLDQFKPGTPFRPWLLTIVVNVTRNQQRSARRWNRNATRAHAGTGGDGTGASAEHEALANDLHASVRDALHALPTKYREVVTCRYLLELTEHETATVLGLPAGTVKSRLSRALARMETHLEKETSDG